MKTIGIVTKLAAMAEARASYFGGHGMAQQKREGREVYRVEYTKTDMSGDTVELYHYGTKTAELWKTARGWTVLHVYGQSRSDADSVNTFMQYHNLDERYTYKPVNGGFQEVE